jgi:hypothetical protein
MRPGQQLHKAKKYPEAPAQSRGAYSLRAEGPHYLGGAPVAGTGALNPAHP